MSQQVFIPHPKRNECLTKAGLPGWYDGDPMLAQPAQHLDPEKIKIYNQCKNSDLKSKIASAAKDKKTIGIALAIIGLFIIAGVIIKKYF